MKKHLFRTVLVVAAAICTPHLAAAQSVCLTHDADLMRRVYVTAQNCRNDWQPKIGDTPYQRLEARREQLNMRLLAQAQVVHPDAPRDRLLARIDCITADCEKRMAPPITCETGSALGDLALLQDWTATPPIQQSRPVALVDPDILKLAPLPLSSAGIESPVARLVDGESLKRAFLDMDRDTYAARCTHPDIRKRVEIQSEELRSDYGGAPVPWDIPDKLGVEQWVVTCKPDDQDTRWLRVAWQISECNGNQLGFDTANWYDEGYPYWAHDLPWVSYGLVIPNTRAQLTWQLYFGIFDMSRDTAEFLPAPVR